MQMRTEFDTYSLQNSLKNDGCSLIKSLRILNNNYGNNKNDDAYSK